MTGKILHKVVGASHVLKPVGDVRVTQGPSLNRFLVQLAETDILKLIKQETLPALEQERLTQA